MQNLCIRASDAELVHSQNFLLSIRPVVVAVEGVEAETILFKNNVLSRKVMDILPPPPLLREGSGDVSPDTGSRHRLKATVLA